MVVIKRYTLILITIATALCCVMPASAQQQDSVRLNEKSEHQELMVRNQQLQAQEESLTERIDNARRQLYIHRPSMTESKKYSAEIIDLEEQIKGIRSQRSLVISRINVIEQKWLYDAIRNGITEVEIDNIESEQHDSARFLLHNDIFKESLSNEEYSKLLDVQTYEQTLLDESHNYASTYQLLRTTAEEYMAEKSEAVADSIFTKYHTLRDKLNNIDQTIASYWSELLDTKYYAYSYILEKRSRHQLLDRIADEYNETQQRCNNNKGVYISDALMRYVIGRQMLLNYEIEFAREMSLWEAVDSIAEVEDCITTPDYRLEPIEIERRLFIDYEPITVGRTNYYNSNNPLPTLKVYERGTIYRILLGKFKAKQSMSIFKGVKPLYIDRDDKDMYCYYAGGYATREEAADAQTQLKKLGFKAPEICRWHNGEMINLTEIGENDNDTSKAIPLVGKRYMVNIETDALSEEMNAIISQQAPDKRVSRAGGMFVIGTFTDYSEAEQLSQKLTENFSDISVNISEVELK